MADSGLCPTCSSPILPGQAFCATCGAALSGESSQSGSAGSESAAPRPVQANPRAKARGAAGATSGKGRAAAPKASAAQPEAAATAREVQAAVGGEAAQPAPTPDPRLLALGLSGMSRPEAGPPPAPPAQSTLPRSLPSHYGPPPSAQFAKSLPSDPPSPSPVPTAQFAPAPPVPEQRRQPEPELEPEPEPPVRIPGSYVPPAEGFAESRWTLKPSSAGSARLPGSSLSVSVGAIPVSNLNSSHAAVDPVSVPVAAVRPAVPALAPPVPLPGPTPLPAPFETPVPASPLQAAPPYQSGVAAVVPAPSAALVTPLLPATPPAPMKVEASSKPARKESTSALVAFGLVAAGAVVGMASLFLPWAGLSGIGVGTTGSTPPASQWGWGMPAGLLIFLLSGLVLGAASGNDRAQERLPKLAPVIVKVTDLIMPMILGGLYFGVFLLYFTLPWGYGAGIFALLLGAGLLISGGVVTLFFPPEVATGADPV